MSSLFGTDGVRGRANTEPLTPELAFALGRQSVPVLSRREHPRVAVGRDTRISGPMFEAALAAGLCSAGATVVRLGVVPTPVVAYAAASNDIDFGVVLSASHNPFYDNGIKFFSGSGTKLSGEAQTQLGQAVRGQTAGRVSRPTGADVGRVLEDRVVRSRYEDHVVHAIMGRHGRCLDGLTIVLDCAHGATYRLAPRLFRKAGARIIAKNVTPDGININRSCGSTSIDRLSRAVLAAGADFGLAFDGDGDRCLAVTAGGAPVDGDAIMTVCALYFKEHGLLARNTVVATVMTNMGVEALLKQHGIALVRTNVGDRFVAQEMRRSGFVLGGEQSGHVIFQRVLPTGDGIVTGLWLAKIIADHAGSLAELVSGIERYPQVIVNIEANRPAKLAEQPAVGKAIKNLEQQFGSRGRIVVRPSGTEPVVRIMVEGKEESEVHEIARQAADSIASARSTINNHT